MSAALVYNPGVFPPSSSRRIVHRRGTPTARPLLHQPRQRRLRADEPARDRQGRAVRALLAVRQIAAAAVSRRVRRQGRRPTRPRARCRRRRRRARGEALREGLQRVRRRLGRAAGRRPHRLRVRLERPDQGARVGPADGLPRAVDALRALHRQAARPLALSRARRRSRGRRCASATSRTMDAAFEDLRRVDRPDAGILRRGAIRRAPRTPKPCTARRFAPRRSTRCAGCCRQRRSRTSASTARARPSRRCCSACAPARSRKSRDCADADAGRAAQGHPGVPGPGRSAGSRRPVERLPGRHARARRATLARRCSPTSTPEPRDEVTLTDFDPDGEVKIVAAALYAGLRSARRPAARRSRGA